MSIPPTDPRPTDIANKKLMLTIICSGLVVSALCIVLLPIPLPLPVRLAVGFIDLIAAAAIWLIGRQKFSGK
tara:strand:- start:1413 stop:1628 length:216 start_codon:yes stop_codon:yes gene_type:complete